MLKQNDEEFRHYMQLKRTGVAPSKEAGGSQQKRGFLYQNVANLVAKQIESGAYKIGSLLPREEDLAQNLNVSRNTMRHALKLLEDQGLILRKKRVGTVVIASRPNPSMAVNLTSLDSFGQVAERTDFHPATSGPMALPQDLSEVCETDGPVSKNWMRVAGPRTDTLSGQPYSYVAFYFPERFGRVAQLVGPKTGLVYRIIEETFGVTVDTVQVEILASPIGADVAEALGLAEGSVLLKLLEVMREADGSVIEAVEAYYQPETFRYRGVIRPGTAR